MNRIFLFFFSIAISGTAYSQPASFVVSGKVIDANTKQPMQAASVFAQNTTTGTATSADGIFTLRLYNGGYDLVITFTGYETATRRITTADENDKTIVIELHPVLKSMEEVAIRVTNEVKDGWERYGSFFMDEFIGKTTNSRLCILKNKEALKFFFSKKRNRLKVTATEALIVDNKALGYTVKYTLDSFVHDYNIQLSIFTGYPLFEEMQPADGKELAQWQANREKAYKGSILHFMRSVHTKTIGEEGFEIQFIVKNNGSDTAISGLNFYSALNYSKNDSTQVVEISPNQTDMAVLYMHEEPEKRYLDLNPGTPEKFELSVIAIPVTQAIAIEQNGFYYDQNDITITGYWSWEKVADMLPYDYR